MDKKKFKKKKENFYSKEDSDDKSKYVEILFMGIDTQTQNGESYEESEVDLEAQYIVVVDEIEKCRRRNKVLKEKLSKYQEETNQIIMDLKNQLQEAKKTEEDLIVLLKEKIQDSEKLEK